MIWLFIPNFKIIIFYIFKKKNPISVDLGTSSLSLARSTQETFDPIIPLERYTVYEIL